MTKLPWHKKNMMTLNPIFTSRMVFAAHKPIRVYGEGEGNVTVSFAVIQIANLDDKEGWALIQKAQDKVQDMLPYVTTIPSYDLCETDDIHPPTKDKLAKRIAENLIKW